MKTPSQVSPRTSTLNGSESLLTPPWKARSNQVSKSVYTESSLCSKSPGPTISSVCQKTTSAPVSTASGQAAKIERPDRAIRSEATIARTAASVIGGMSSDQPDCSSASEMLVV